MANNSLIVVAGATGNLGGRIVRYLAERDATVRALVRHDTLPGKVDELRKAGASIARVDYYNPREMAEACAGGSCVVSALCGLQDVIIDAQSQLLSAAVKARVPRFIPSDFAIDFFKLPDGSNRNLDMRREFNIHLDRADIAPTSILNGMFTDLLTGPAPVILFRRKRIVYWENADQLLDFTTIDDAAEFTAAAALDPATPRFLRVAGDQISARGLMEVASDLTGKRFKLFRAGGLGRLAGIIKLMRLIMREGDDVYPPWQGMQYLHNMFSGQATLEPLDNGRYPEIRYTNVSDFLSADLANGR
jgi:nucleoside-diphosphate-sugar epimerase